MKQGKGVLICGEQEQNTKLNKLLNTGNDKNVVPMLLLCYVLYVA